MKAKRKSLTRLGSILINYKFKYFFTGAFLFIILITQPSFVMSGGANEPIGTLDTLPHNTFKYFYSEKFPLSTKKKNRFEEAIGRWVKVAPMLTFEKLATPPSEDDLPDGYNNAFAIKYKRLQKDSINGFSRQFLEIVFNKKVDWDVSKNASNISIFKRDFKAVAVHEIGHAIGLGHVKKEDGTRCRKLPATKNWVMCPYSSLLGAGPRHPAGGEEKALTALYD